MEALSFKGVVSSMATDGLTGLRMFSQGQYDVVITDINLPDVDGNEVAKEIRKSAEAPVKIIGISGEFWRLEQHLFDASFEKPFRLLHLVKTVTGAP